MRQEMATAAAAVLSALSDEQMALGHLGYPVDSARRSLEYRPRPRPGISLADLTPKARKAAHRLLATGLSSHAFAQAMAVLALEEVLDRAEGWARGRHSDDYWVAIFGNPAEDQWAWRFEGHHLSVNVAVQDGEVFATPMFFGANPATVSYAGRPVLRPLAPEEDLARALLDGMGPHNRREAIVREQAPIDIHSGPSPQAPEAIEPYGISSSKLDHTSRTLLRHLTDLYFSRLPEALAAKELERLDSEELHFAWEGPTQPGVRHYYRIQAPDLLIEYDNTSDDANHVHTVVRKPASDFGGNPLATHRANHHA